MRISRAASLLQWAPLLLLMAMSPLAAEGQAAPDSAYQAITTAHPELPLDELALLVKPLTADELQAEAEAWLGLLRAKTLEVSQAEIAVKQKNRTIQQAEEVQEAIEETQEILEEVREAAEDAQGDSTVDAAEKVSELAEAASEAASEAAADIDDVIQTAAEVANNPNVQQTLDQTSASDTAGLSEKAQHAEEAAAEVSRSANETLRAADSGHEQDAARLAAKTVGAVGEAQQALIATSDAVAEAVEGTELEDSHAQLDQTAEAVEALAEEEMEDKLDMLELTTNLRAERTGLIDRLSVVLDEWSSKLPEESEGGENSLLTPYRLYASSVAGIQVDISDTQAAWSSLIGWLRSDVGGVRWASNLGMFLLTVFASWAVGQVLARVCDKAMRLAGRPALMIREFIVRSVRRGSVVMGILIGLTALNVNIGPLLAVLGAASFVIGLALQSTLSNFASGMMIMVYRPFDVGDWIEVGGVVGIAQSMNLVTTTIATLDNQIMIVPNNEIWGNTIINITGSEIRRVDLIVGISYNDEIAVAERLMHEILKENPLVLDEPEPVIAVQELAEYSVNFVCRPWTETANYWQVRWEVTRAIKERFEAAGLETPYPHHHLHHRASPDSPVTKAVS